MYIHLILYIVWDVYVDVDVNVDADAGNILSYALHMYHCYMRSQNIAACCLHLHESHAYATLSAFSISSSMVCT